MGVPSFYRWLVDKYPKVVVDVVEERGDAESVDATKPNPNGNEFDNLYLDMNAIIHPCFHPDDAICPPTTYEEVFEAIFQYIDRLFRIVRPRKLLYLAIDGVAPRAKMNQQRRRRFQAAKNNEIAEEEETRLREQFERQGKKLLPRAESDLSDSNIITPGTLFMSELAKALKGYIQLRIKTDPPWRDINVILSDSNAPGEGEHKIMSFICSQRTLPGYDPNTRHCLYGLDADLIMLALATHELHFSILREKDSSPSLELEQLSNSEPTILGSIKQKKEIDGNSKEVFKPRPSKKPYQLLHIWVLREYLEKDLQILDPPEKFKFDLERIVDDFVFMCFFVGNDFLPHMPTLEIHEGAIDLLLYVYKGEFKNLGGYLVDMERVKDHHHGYIKLKRVEKLILAVGSFEQKIFEKRADLRLRKLRRALPELSESQGGIEEEDEQMQNMPAKNEDHVESHKSTSSKRTESEMMLQNTKELNQRLKSFMQNKSDVFKNSGATLNRVKLGTQGWKERYYKEKFSVENSESIERTRKDVVQSYTEGLHWVLLYYYSGVASWSWFYPYYYGPFASDLKGLGQVKVKFEKSEPFCPFDQLMAVLPPRSAEALPKVYRPLMIDKESDIIRFYPKGCLLPSVAFMLERCMLYLFSRGNANDIFVFLHIVWTNLRLFEDFDIDVDGKRFEWQGTCKLPFIDGKRLQEATAKVVNNIEETEADRNMEKDEYLFVSSANNFRAELICLSSRHASVKEEGASNVKWFSGGELSGSLRLADYGSQDNIHPEAQDRVLCFSFKLRDADKHIPKLVQGVETPEKTVDESDILERMLWHDYKGSRHPQTRLLNQPASRWKQVDDTNDKVTSSSKGAIHKYDGTGWARGGGNNTQRSQCSGFSSYQGRTDSAFSYPENYGDGRRGNTCYSDRNAGPSSSYRPPHVQGRWQRAEVSNSVIGPRFERMRLSTSEEYTCYGRGTFGRGTRSNEPSSYWRPSGDGRWAQSQRGSGGWQQNSSVFDHRSTTDGQWRGRGGNMWNSTGKGAERLNYGQGSWN
ncbi:5'-3' exoribonuclease 3-like protein [Drosera capensis]